MSRSDKIDLEAPLTGELVEWNVEKQYGFLEIGRLRIFLHIRDFAEHHKRPAIGDKINFLVGQDAQGRTCAKQAVHVNDGGRISVVNLLVLASLLVLPVLALWRWRVDWRLAGGLGLVMPALAYGAYAVDKRRAREKAWRLSEAKLQLLALLGGWPGAFLAHRRLRHKCSKWKFQFLFWLIVALYQFAAFDSLQNWNYTKTVWKQLDDAAHRFRQAR